MITGELKSQDRRGLERLLVGRHLEPARGDRADHLPAVHQAPRRAPDAARRTRPTASASRSSDAIFPEGNDDARAAPTRPALVAASRTSRPAEMFDVVGEHVFPFLRTLGGDGSTYATHMKDARFTIPTPALLAKAVDVLDDVPMEDRDTKGDVYEYMLGKIATAGQNGQFRTPAPHHPADGRDDRADADRHDLRPGLRHLRLPRRRRRVPARAPSRAAARREAAAEHFHDEMFHGFDFDNTMLRIGSMNMLLHGVENPDIRYRDSLAQDHAGDEEALHPGPRQPAVRRVARLRDHRQGPARRSSRPRRPSCCSSPCSCGCSSPAGGRR